MPERTPLQTRIFGRVEREGYSVEKVWIQTYPGLYLGGNLYRPLGKGEGPFPAILNPHGHWSSGRMADEPSGSIAARCISFARQGMIAFSYDMVGYNDTFFPDHGPVPADKFYVRHRRFATNEANLLWNISLMGLQTWNSIRALDFLESLPDTDRSRLACTGESGGGTQTFMLSAIDDRLAAQAPIVMVSHSMQGGCLCENAPGLRVDYSNMEIAASAAPRPQFLVAATGDWTKATLVVEGPSIRQVYELFGAADRFGYVRFDFGHNYNQTSREAVYGFFAKTLCGNPSSEALKEPPYKKEPDQDLRVFPDNQLPQGAVSEGDFLSFIIRQSRDQVEALAPTSKSKLARFQEVFLPAWKHTLHVDWPTMPPKGGAVQTGGAQSTRRYVLDPSSADERQITFSLELPAKPAKGKLVALATAEGQSKSPESMALTAALLAQGFTVAQVDLSANSVGVPDQFANFYSVYNRTVIQRNVRDLARVCAFARDQLKAGKILLIGEGPAGLSALLAAPFADGVLADANQLDSTSTSSLLAPDVFCPGLLKIGGFEGAAILAMPHPLLVYNTGPSFTTGKLRSAYRAVGAENKLRIETAPIPADGLAAWARSF
jgi:dienelactone hydrolase